MIIDALDELWKNEKGKYSEWIHFGDGLLMSEMSNRAEKLGDIRYLEYKLMGKVDNDTIQKYYSDNKVDYFITTSSTEGFQ